MRRMIFTATLAAILAATVAACGGDSGKTPQENFHPVLPNHIYLQIQEEWEYIILWETFANRHLSERVNALHQGGYEIEPTTRDRFDNYLLIFRKIASPEESSSSPSTTAAN